MYCSSKNLSIFLMTAFLAFAFGVGTVKVLQEVPVNKKEIIETVLSEQQIKPSVKTTVDVYDWENSDPCKEIKSRSGGKASNNYDVHVGVLNSKSCIVEPYYPEEAVYKNISGRVLVKAKVDGYGIVRSATAISGNELLAKSAVEAAYKTKVLSIMLGGEPMNIEGVFVYDFILSK